MQTQPQQPLEELEALRKENAALLAETEILSSRLSDLVKIVDMNLPQNLVSFQQTLEAAKEALFQNAMKRLARAQREREQ